MDGDRDVDSALSGEDAVFVASGACEPIVHQQAVAARFFDGGARRVADTRREQ